MTVQSPTTSLSIDVADVVRRTGISDVPPPVLERARHLILDAVGIAFASSGFGFADVAARAATSFGPGEQPVLGRAERLGLRDAATLNGILVHGLDFDDTHSRAVAHVSSAVLPAALASALDAGCTTNEFLLSYVLGVEVMARVGSAARGQLHDVGFHPTAIAGAFGATVAAGKNYGLTAGQLANAQGIAGSFSAGLMEFLQDGAWTKRLHPGWAASSGITAALYARAGWSGPPAVFEGRFGLFATHLQQRTDVRPDIVTDGLGSEWELPATAVKPYPVCHFNHAFIDAALELRRQHALRPEDVASITCAIHSVPRKVVCEPTEAKWAPRDDYDAKFSLPFVVAAALVRGRVGLAELEDDALTDPEILATARKVRVVDDPDSAFPEAYSGLVEIETVDGTTVSHREQINRGHSRRPLDADAVIAKFRQNVGRVADDAVIDRVQQAVLGIGDDRPVAEFADACSSSSRRGTARRAWGA